jgi:hypothetical protein
MERQAGLGRSLEDVLDSLTPIESADSPPTHVLFGLGPDEAVSTNGAKQKKNEKKHAADGKSDSKKKKKKKKKDSKGKKSKGKKKK